VAVAVVDGVVTFLFTDIEGSTRLWEHQPARMREALGRHDALMRNAIERSGGTVFKTVGDAFCAVFDRPVAALEAAIAAQRALSREPWPAPVAIKVRMALHTEAAEARDGDYFGPALNRVARLLSAGHGGQVLLTAAARDAIGAAPPEVEFRDLGERRLRHLIRAERVHQVVAPGLAAEFPPLTTPDARAHNLPATTTSFVGRDDERATVHARLDANRLVTLTGAGGTGKTRLALQVAAERVDQSADGTWFVDLAPLTDARLVAQAAASALDVKEQAGVPMDQALARHLAAKEVLLCIDNCEHVVEAAAALCQRLLSAGRGIRILATSREPLRVPGEAVFRVPSLAVPAVDAGVEEVMRTPSAQLFMDRARAVQPSFRLKGGDAQVLSRLCRRLDGIPLALELAAARVRALSLDDIDRRLDQRLRLLTGGARTALPRQQTLRSTIDWSHDLLDAAERALLCRLAVFAGGWTLDAAEAVCAGDPIDEHAVVDLMTSLADKSLAIADDDAGGVRYRFLESVREYARERLCANGDERAWCARHLAHVLALAEEAKPHLTASGQEAWLARLDAEHENVRAALAWSMTSREHAADGLRLVAAYWRFWYMRGHLDEGCARLAEQIDRSPGERTEARAEALSGLGVLVAQQGDQRRARPCFDEALAIRRERGDTAGIARSLSNLATLAAELGDLAQAQALYEQSLAAFRQVGDDWGAAMVLGNLGIVATDRGEPAIAQARIEESLAIRRKLGDRYGVAAALYALALALQGKGDVAKARRCAEESLELRIRIDDRVGMALARTLLAELALADGDGLAATPLAEAALSTARALGERWVAAAALRVLGVVAALEGDLARALERQREALGFAAAINDPAGIAAALDAIADVASRTGDGARAATAWAAARRLRESAGLPVPASSRSREQAADEAGRAGVIDAATVEASWQHGSNAAIDEIVAMMLADGSVT
jgi:predicted ATPase/class 3 adenylate cyclase